MIAGAIFKYVSGGLLFVCLMLGLALHMERRHSAKLAAQLTSEHEARMAEREANRQAQEAAAAKNQAQVAKVEQQYQRKSDDEREAYLRDLAKLRANRMRQQDAAPKGSPNGAIPPQDCPAPPGANGDGVQVSSCRDVQEEASEIELRLMHLQNYVDGLLGIDPNAK